MRSTFHLAVTALALTGCSRFSEHEAREQTVADCTDRFSARAVGMLVDRLGSRAGESTGFSARFDAVAHVRSDRDLENLLARLDAARGSSIGYDGKQLHIHVEQSSNLEMNRQAMAKTLQEACSTVASYNGRISSWEWVLGDDRLDDGLYKMPAVS